MYRLYVKMPTQIADLSQDRRRRRFQGAYGCIDGSHVPIEVREEEKENWRNQKGYISTNALMCTTDDSLCFTYASLARKELA